MAGGAEAVLDRITGDWLAAVDALEAAGVADTSNVGYRGRPGAGHPRLA
jgi:hypothetical protein